MKDMLGREEVLQANKALDLILNSLADVRLKEIESDIEVSNQKVLSQDIFSPEDLPGFSRSTMDGYAVRSSDTFGAKEGMPAYLSVNGEIFMGESPAIEVEKGRAAIIPTGGMLPEGADAVVMLEHASYAGDMLEVFKPVAPGENVIQAGEDCKKGEKILSKGHRLRPQELGALAGVGITKIWVYENPKVAIISTGDEIVPANSPLRPGQVRDINSFTLSGLIENLGGKAIKKGIVRDSYKKLKKAVEESMLEADIIAVTGGSSVGTKDLTSKIINDSGSPGVLFHGVSVKPGKPTIGGIVNGRPIFGLPGHPAAIIVSFELFLSPVLKLLSGESEKLSLELKKTVLAKLSKNLSSSAGREDHVRVSLEIKDNELWANPILGKSGLITTLVRADGTIIIPLNKLGLEQGSEVKVELF